MQPQPDRRDADTFAQLTTAAANGQRCPVSRRDMGQIIGLDPNAVQRLARAGHIRIEISGRNWRVVEILTGPHVRVYLTNGHRVIAPADFCARGKPADGDFLVQYANPDGTAYLSWSSRQAFLDGYSPA